LQLLLTSYVGTSSARTASGDAQITTATVAANISSLVMFSLPKPSVHSRGALSPSGQASLTIEI
jgi:hypothetical protein